MAVPVAPLSLTPALVRSLIQVLEAFLFYPVSIARDVALHVVVIPAVHPALSEEGCAVCCLQHRQAQSEHEDGGALHKCVEVCLHT